MVWVQDYQLQLVPQMLRTAAARPADRLLPAHPVPAHRAVPQLPWRNQILRGSARRRPGRIPAARRRAELRPAGPAAAQSARPAGTGSVTPDGRTVLARAYPISIDAQALHDLAMTEETKAARQADPARPRRPEVPLPRRRPARLHQGPAGTDPGLRRAGRRRHRSTPTRRSSSRSPPRRGSGSTSTASCATTSTGWSAGSTATSAGSAGRRSPTCTPPTRARRWPRSTGRPTSWSSRRCGTG